MRRFVRLLAVAAWLFGVASLVPSSLGAQSSGAVLDAHGWWNKAQALPVQGDPTGLGVVTVPSVPAPATVPEDGLHVANDASGAAAIAAVRYRLDGRGGGTMTLHLAEGSTLTGAEEVVACPVVGGWEPAQNGRWDAKPGYDEAACIINGVATEAGDALTFDVPSTFASVLGDISFVIAPAPDSTTPFTLAFTKPADADFVVTTPVVATPSTPGAAPAYQPGAPAFTAPSASPSFDAPSTPTISSPPPGGGDEVAAPAPSLATSPAADIADEASRTPQVLAVVLLAAIGAALWWLASQPQRAPRLLGSVGGPSAAEAPAMMVAATAKPRGVGRFARPRTARANPL